jgi:hypothetical protein
MDYAFFRTGAALGGEPHHALAQEDKYWRTMMSRPEFKPLKE